MKKVFFGWKHFRPKEGYVQIKNMGGTWKIPMPKDSTKDQLKQKALELFFPGGNNPQVGSEENVTSVIAKYDNTELPDQIEGQACTLQSFITKEASHDVRLYLLTR